MKKEQSTDDRVYRCGMTRRIEMMAGAGVWWVVTFLCFGKCGTVTDACYHGLCSMRTS